MDYTRMDANPRRESRDRMAEGNKTAMMPERKTSTGQIKLQWEDSTREWVMQKTESRVKVKAEKLDHPVKINNKF